MKHIILIGFKQVGKSAVGLELSQMLHLSFVDLDKVVENIFTEHFLYKFSCRQIVQQKGEKFFRDLETTALKKVLQSTERCVIASGGGTPVKQENCELIKDHLIIHLTAPKNVVFERIMINGRPAFFSTDETPLQNFRRLWKERLKIYQTIAKHTIHNDKTITAAVQDIISYLIN